MLSDPEPRFGESADDYVVKRPHSSDGQARPGRPAPAPQKCLCRLPG
jgi:hypothetical protein